ncbi:MAG: hypothetical protein NZ899_10950 [Thermoguttaceae bacterium]|nr:hypothetical protein [Thermoguttaceae bacterium]MDW8079158.1 hypothetical protein [Thermoguttaceae bacterium]
MSRRSQFSHSYALAIAPQRVVAEELPLCCLKSAPPVHSQHRQLGQKPLVERPRCGGIWLSHGELAQLIRRADSGIASNLQEPERSLSPRRTYRASERVAYYPCPVCKQLMNRRCQYGTSVIVDICGRHGLWFDADELATVLKSGAARQVSTTDHPGETPAAEERSRSPARRLPRAKPFASRRIFPFPAGGSFIDLLAILLAWLFR